MAARWSEPERRPPTRQEMAKLDDVLRGWGGPKRRLVYQCPQCKKWMTKDQAERHWHMGARWNDQGIETLKQLWGEGKTASEIAEALGDGVTRNMVIGKAHRLGLESRPSPIKSAP